jgi:hypothetical protein
LGQQVLRQDGEAIRHGVRRRAGVFAGNGSVYRRRRRQRKDGRVKTAG